MCTQNADWLQPKLPYCLQAGCCSYKLLAYIQDCQGKHVSHPKLSACRYLGATYDGSSSGKHGVVTGADVPRLAYESFPLCMLVSKTHKYWSELTGRLCRERAGLGDDVSCQGAGGPGVMHQGSVTCLPATKIAGSSPAPYWMVPGVWKATAAMQPPLMLAGPAPAQCHCGPAPAQCYCGPAPAQCYCNLTEIAGGCCKSCAMM